MKGDFSRDTFDPGKHYARVLMQQGRVQLDADWNEQQSIHHYRIATESTDVVGASGAPLHNPGFKLTTTADGKSLIIGAGRYYVGGLLCENESDVAYAAQPDLPNPPEIIAAMTKASTKIAIVYLDAWIRQVTALDDPLIRETALGGPDTTTRAKTVWQVKALAATPDGGGGSLSCGDSLKAWDQLIAPSTGVLSARAQPTQPTDSPCLLPPGAGYTRLENQLYRVEIHSGGNPGVATFKWSRDNGAVLTSVESINGQDITVHDLGRDDALGFASGDWVEVSDDAHELSGTPAQLVQIDHVNVASRVISVKQAVTGIDVAQGARLRRWDGASTTGLVVSTPATNDGWIPLEDGIEVKFGTDPTATFAPGDYWLIPARTARGDVEWPFSAPQPARSAGHSYTRLGIATLVGDALSLQDCRSIFSPLAEQPPALHVTGINWLNDDVVSQDLIGSGLQVFLDGVVAPSKGDSASAIAMLRLAAPVTLGAGGALDVVSTDGQVTGEVELNLIGDVTFPQPNILQWKPTKDGAQLKTLITVLVAQRVARVRLTFTLRGHAIWQEGGSDLVYLDGRALGQKGARADNSPRIDLRLPSGSGATSSDFVSWFYLQLQLPAPSVADFAVSPAVVIAGNPVTGIVTLDFPAGAAGASVALLSASPSVTFPTNPVNVPAGKQQATFPVNTNAGQGGTNVVLTATLGTSKQQTLFVQVVVVAISPPALSMFTGRSQQFTANVTGANDPTVIWSVAETNGGSINSSGFYVAPSSGGTFHVVATSAADPSKRATAAVTVTTKPKEKEGKEFEKVKDRTDVIIEPRPIGRIDPRGPIDPRVVRIPNRSASSVAGLAIGVGRPFIRPAERPRVGPSASAPLP
jgi:hypothetical protein